MPSAAPSEIRMERVGDVSKDSGIPECVPMEEDLNIYVKKPFMATSDIPSSSENLLAPLKRQLFPQMFLRSLQSVMSVSKPFSGASRNLRVNVTLGCNALVI